MKLMETNTEDAGFETLLFWQFMVSYSVAGAVEHMAMFPVETLKTRRQTIGPFTRLYLSIAAMGLACQIFPHRLLLGLQVIQEVFGFRFKKTKEVFGFFGWWLI
ncbi:hypothetical protein RHSIM_Rhsim01G0200500 [Rhododendron simsii]|uniref:Uncharacterized protein n=1 Tax=Rhododendron simsii TaxID=118357 RepID=A0A834M1C0_RHOSS|nr:hypothetical protein RHSIM_Rhsim01G0200500 [Rhododendron simsii]